MTTVRARRVYEAPDAADGRRVLVGRLWPRGPAKAAAGPVTLLTAPRDLEHSQAADLAKRLRRSYRG
jgi:uncharacterized protein YeaO (DUF488 family)